MADTTILVTGGAGFVGSHFVRAACEARATIIVLDDLSGGPAPRFPDRVRFVRGDIADRSLVSGLLREGVTEVVHFAGKIQVGESLANPAAYFETNLAKTLVLLEVVRAANIEVFLFSSTAAVYGAPTLTPIEETASPAPINPYGMSKLGVEYALESYGRAYGLRWAALRYFNAAGAHPDGTLREGHEPETHLIPLAIDAALGRCPGLNVFGDDYSTTDGTCIRDYVHVCDLAEAHLAAIEALRSGVHVGATNLGSGTGVSVRQVIDTCEQVMGRSVPHTITARRAGDPPVLLASIEKARRLLHWIPRRSELRTIVEDAVRSRS